MSLLQRLAAAISENVLKFEEELLSGSPGKLPHLWEAKLAELDHASQIPSAVAFQLLEKIRTDLRALEAVVTPTRYKMLNLAMAEQKASCLNVATTLKVADAIQDLGGSVGSVELGQLAKHLDVNENKLGRVLRMLALEFIFRETSPNVFANTRHSIALLRKDNFHPFLSLAAVEGALSATGLAANMEDPKSKHSFHESTAPFVSTVSTTRQTFMQYCMQEENAHVLGKVTQGVVPWLNKVTRKPLLQDYPWGELGKSTVIDISCGPGDSGFDIIRQYPSLRWVFQDLDPVIQNLQSTIPDEFNDKVKSGNISFVAQDYFQPNVSVGNLWYLRGVIREYDDDKVFEVLNHIANAMRKTEGSRLVINEVLCSSAPMMQETGADDIPSKHIPQNQSMLAETANLMTWNTFCVMGGKERSLLEMEIILGQAGLAITRFFQFRSFTTMIECQLNT